MGISIQDIEKQNMPLPKRNMLPISLEEEIICFADKFFSKTKDSLTEEVSIDEIRKHYLKFGSEKVRTFDERIEKF
jgi:uncharacterized protein